MSKRKGTETFVVSWSSCLVDDSTTREWAIYLDDSERERNMKDTRV